MMQIPRGRYYTTNTNGHITYSIMFYGSTKNYNLSCDSFTGLLTLVDMFFSPSSKFETLSSYNVALQSSLEDTVNIDLEQLNNKKAA